MWCTRESRSGGVALVDMPVLSHDGVERQLLRNRAEQLVDRLVDGGAEALEAEVLEGSVLVGQKRPQKKNGMAHSM